MLSTIAMPLAGSASAAPYVLLVDDHLPSLSQLLAVVEGAGHRCLAAGSGRDALRYCAALQPHVVVTDLSMPNLDGCGLAVWVKELYPSIPIVLLTGEILDARALCVLGGTFASVFQKPLDVGAFLTFLDRLMPRVSNRKSP